MTETTTGQAPAKATEDPRFMAAAARTAAREDVDITVGAPPLPPAAAAWTERGKRFLWDQGVTPGAETPHLDLLVEKARGAGLVVRVVTG